MMSDAGKKIIHHYFEQLTDGCGNNQCQNIYCASSPKFKYDRKLFEDRNKAAAEALILSSQHADLCLDQNTFVNNKKIDLYSVVNNKQIGLYSVLTEENLVQIIDQCKESNNWTLLKKTIGAIFSDRQSLSSSFLREDFLHTIPNDAAVPESASATPKSHYTYDARITLDSDELSLDFDAMQRSIKLLSLYEDEISSVINTALRSLANQIRLELTASNRYTLETDAHFFNLFFIVFELPFLSDPMFIYDSARVFYSLLTQLSLDAQAKIVRLLAKHIKQLRAYVGHIQQYITMLTERWSEHTIRNSNTEPLLSSQPGMNEGLDVLRILFYANLLGSQRDRLETIEKEREGDRQMEIELIKRRRRRIDGSPDDEHQEQQEQEQQQSQTENTSATASARRQLSNLTSRTSTSEQEESVSPYENPLQTKLDLHPNEYRHGHLPFDDFVNEHANERIEITKEYVDYVRQRSDSVRFSFIFYPFFLSTINKIALLNIENKVQMYHQRRTIFVHNIFSRIPQNPFFKLCIRRNHLIEDALIALQYQGIEQPAELKKQLFVEFDGEQGHDEGGLSKEFFQLITEQIFDTKYAMFMADDETRSLWFNPSAAEDLDDEYTLIGMLLGLAIYNSIILDVKFPPVLYRKLMGKIGSFEDLEKSHPTIYKSLKNLLTYDEQQEGASVEDAFGLTFQVVITDATGTRLTFDLKDNGENISVTNENREEFVRLYSDLLLNKSIERQFHPFFLGFLLVTWDSSLRKLFRPDEIELLVAGSQVLDFDQLASAAEYDAGYTKDSQTIKNFWSVLMTFTDEQKRKFLRFATGSDRTPIGGLAKLRLIISRNGPDTDRLPTAHTCFNAFLLPDYSTLEKLREKLLIAINNAEGFGLL